jgi:hypothetical protein
MGRHVHVSFKAVNLLFRHKVPILPDVTASYGPGGFESRILPIVISWLLI